MTAELMPFDAKSVEPVELSAEDARALTDQIRVATEATWQLVKQAYEGRAWTALGYSSWDDYCTREFGSSRIRLPREERAEVVSSLRESGLSLRAIEAATGVSRPTIIKDLAAAAQVVNSLPPEPDPEPVDAEVIECEPSGLDEFAPADDIDCDDEPTSAAPAPIATVTGIDGKSYPAATSTPREPRRKPLTDAFDSATYDLKRSAERVTRLAGDDRFAKNKDQIAGSNLSDLVRVRDAINSVIQQIEG